VKTSIRSKLLNAKRRIVRRLQPRQWADQSQPMFAARNIQYEIATRTQGVASGGIGAMHLLARRIGLIESIDRHLHLLKQHKPYHESDHVLNIRQVLHDFPRLSLERLPPYAPDLNPVEYLRGYLKYGKLPNFVPDDVFQLNVTLNDHLQRTRTCSDRLSGYFDAAKLPFR